MRCTFHVNPLSFSSSTLLYEIPSLGIESVEGESAVVAKLIQEVVEASSSRLNMIMNKLEEEKQREVINESEEKIGMADILSLGMKLNVIHE